MAEQTIQWASLNLGALVPDEVTALVDLAQGVVTTLQAVVDVVGGILDILANLLLADLDLTKLSILALVEAVNAAISFFESTSISIAWYVPTAFRNAPTVPLLLEKFAASFSDESDADRPLTQDEDTFYLMWFVIAATRNLANVRNILAPLFEFLGRPLAGLGLGGAATQLELARKSVLGRTNKWPPVMKSAQGQEPNWTSLRLADFGPIAEIVTALKGMRDAVAKPGDNVDQVRARVELILARVEKMEEKVQQVIDAIQEVTDLARDMASPRVHMLAVFGQGDTLEQQRTLRRATTRPDYPLKDRKGLDYGGAFVVHVQSDVGSTINTIRTMLGVSDSATEFVESELVEPTEQSSIAIVGGAKLAKESWNVG